MLLTKYVEIIGNSKNLKYYKSKNLNLNIGEKITINVFDLSHGSTFKVDVECDICYKVKSMAWSEYVKYTKNSAVNYCRKCNTIKRIETNQKKYGGNSPACDEEIVNKIKSTNIKKYGNNSSLHGSQQGKTENIFLEKYGTKTPSILDSVKNKMFETNKIKYGGKSPFSDIKIIEKMKNTNFGKYGCLTINENEDYRKNNFNIAKHPYYNSYIEDGISLFNCDLGKEHTFEIHRGLFKTRNEKHIPLCTICYPIGDQKSIKEKEVLRFIDKIYKGEIISSYRDQLEIDVYLPELNIGFEFNGLYWHSTERKDKNYHLNKLNYFKERKIHIVNIWEDDWEFKRDIIHSQIRNQLRLTENKKFARKCIIKEIKDYANFIADNCIYEYTPSKINLGLFYNKELVSVMGFDNFDGRKKMGDNEWNLSIFCGKINTTVVGGASKLINYFIKIYNPCRIITYVDKSLYDGRLYPILGFSLIKETKPDYKYIVGSIRKNKTNFAKTEKLGYHRIYDCGKMKFELKINL